MAVRNLLPAILYMELPSEAVKAVKELEMWRIHKVNGERGESEGLDLVVKIIFSLRSDP